MHCKNGDVMLYILYFCLNFCVFVVHAITRLQAFFLLMIPCKAHK
jgi:hypothetical protein